MVAAGMPGARSVLSGPGGAVSAGHPLAVAAGQEMLRAGGTAVDAAVAAQAVLGVVLPHACGLGGDAMFLVAEGDGSAVAVNGAGSASAASQPGPIPMDGGGRVTVPGAVAAWATVLERWGALDPKAVLEPAARLAEARLPVGPSVARAARMHRDRLVRHGGAAWRVATIAHPEEAMWSEELARSLRTIATEGAEWFYRGSMAGAMVRAVRREGGTLGVDDLAAHQSTITEPIAVPWRNAMAWVQPPMSQAVLLAMALQWLERSDVIASPQDRDHALVEVIGAAFEHRDRVADGRGLLEERLDVDLELATRRPGPRSAPHTTGVAAADSLGLVVSSLASLFDDFGSATFVPEGGFVLNDRAAGFTVAPNDPAPGKQPVHTLSPVLLRGQDMTMALATPGGDGQVQTLLQVLAAIGHGDDSLADAVARPRWRSEEGLLLIERSHPHRSALARRGHDVHTLADGDERFGAVVAAGTVHGVPRATADWRRQAWAGVL